MQRRLVVIVLALVAWSAGAIPAARQPSLRPRPAPGILQSPEQPRRPPGILQSPPQPHPGPGILLEDLTWLEAEKALTPDTIVVIPIGAAAKEHGPHLRLKNDFVLAEYFKRRLLERLPVVVAPTVNYHFYPSFVEYPGSTTLRLETARDLIVDICRGLARFGPRRFYALNTGVSTIRALQPAAELLAADGVLLRFTDILKVGAAAEASVRQQEGGTHADEIETSLMLYTEPSLVDMRKAVKDYHPSGTGGLTRDPKSKGIYSPTGIWGDPTLATREKGRIVVEAMVEGMVAEVKALAAATPIARTKGTALWPHGGDNWEWGVGPDMKAGVSTSTETGTRRLEPNAGWGIVAGLTRTNGDHPVLLEQCPPEYRVLMMPSSRHILPPDGLNRGRHVRIKGVSKVIPGDNHERDLVPRRHDAQTAGLEVELAGLNDARQGMHDHHHPPFQPLRAFGRVDRNLAKLVIAPQSHRRVHHMVSRAEPDVRSR